MQPVLSVVNLSQIEQQGITDFAHTKTAGKGFDKILL